MTNLTDTKIRAEKGRKTRREVHDGDGLYLIVQPSGAKSFALRYRQDGKHTKLTLGPYFSGDIKDAPEPKIGSPLTLKGARKLAGDKRLEIDKGGDPAAAHRKAAVNTFEAVTNEYFQRVGNKKLRRAADRYAALKKRVFPVIGEKPVNEIQRGDIIRLLRKIEDEAGPVMADRTLAYIRKVFNWYAFQDEKFKSPIVRGMAEYLGFESVSRDRILTDDEIRAVWTGEGVFSALVRFLLLTGARRSEATEMKWEEVKDGDWLLPARRNKTKRDLLRPLSRAAKALIEQQPKVCDFVFSTNGVGHISGYGRHKEAFDAAVLAELRKEDPEAKPLENWVLHDLRRTARSLLSRAGINTDHAERCLGHVIAGVRGIYDRHEYYDEKKKAFEALAVQIELIVNPPSDNVVAFQKAAE
jgi:integrase